MLILILNGRVFTSTLEEPYRNYGPFYTYCCFHAIHVYGQSSRLNQRLTPVGMQWEAGDTFSAYFIEVNRQYGWPGDEYTGYL